jgi:hypothetical protein
MRCDIHSPNFHSVLRRRLRVPLLGGQDWQPHQSCLAGNHILAPDISLTDTIAAISSCPGSHHSPHLDHQTIRLQPHLSCLPTSCVHTPTDLFSPAIDRPLCCGDCFYQWDNLWSQRRTGSSFLHGRHGRNQVRQPHRYYSTHKSYFRGRQPSTRFVPYTSTFTRYLEALPSGKTQNGRLPYLYDWCWVCFYQD